MSYIRYINEYNKLLLNRPLDSNVIYFSELNEWFTKNAFRSVGIKYVINGTIMYKVGRKEYQVQPDKFLVTGKQPDVMAYFDSDTKVKSLCIDICPASIAEAYTILASQSKLDLENYTFQDFTYPRFGENIYSAKGSMIERKLALLASHIQNHEPSPINYEWFLDMAELIVLQEFDTFKSLESLKDIKPATRKELLQRLAAGKSYIDDFYLKSPSIDEVAKVCNMSPFHFLRRFKQAFHTTPHQYILSKKLLHSHQLLHNSRESITRVATLSGFPDLFTFSKAFKKRFGINPSAIK